MSIQIVNDQFKAFVSFAQEALRTDAGENSVARLSREGGVGLADRNISAITVGHDDAVHAFIRSSDSKQMNDDVRETFLNAIVRIFGNSIEDVPESVRTAMKMGDFGKGRPLTARRIMAVNESITQVLTQESKALAQRMQIEKGIPPADFQRQAKEAIKAGMGDSVMNRFVARLSNELSDRGVSAKEIGKLEGLLNAKLEIYGRSLKSEGPDKALGNLIDEFNSGLGTLSGMQKSTKAALAPFVNDLKTVYFDVMMESLREKVKTQVPEMASLVTDRVISHLIFMKQTGTMGRVVSDIENLISNLKTYGSAIESEIQKAEPILLKALTAGYGEENANKMIARLKDEMRDGLVNNYYGNTSPRPPAIVDNARMLLDNPWALKELGFDKLLDEGTLARFETGSRFALPARLSDDVTTMFFKKLEVPAALKRYEKPMRVLADQIIRDSRKAKADRPDDPSVKVLSLQEGYEQALAMIKRAHEAAGGDRRVEMVLESNCRTIFINSANIIRSEEKVLAIIQSHKEAFKAADDYRNETGIDVEEPVMAFCDQMHATVIEPGAVKNLLNAARTFADGAFKGFDGTVKSFVKGFVALTRAASLGTGHGLIDTKPFPLTAGDGTSAVTNLFVRTVLATMDVNTRQAVADFVKGDVFTLLHRNNDFIATEANRKRTDIADAGPRVFYALESYVEGYMNIQIAQVPAKVKISSLGIDPLDLTIFQGKAVEGLSEKDRDLYDIGMALYSQPHTPDELKELEGNIAQWVDAGIPKAEILARLASREVS